MSRRVWALVSAGRPREQAGRGGGRGEPGGPGVDLLEGQQRRTENEEPGRYEVEGNRGARRSSHESLKISRQRVEADSPDDSVVTHYRRFVSGNWRSSRGAIRSSR